MKIEETKQGKAVIFALEGRLDSTTSLDVEQSVLRTINEGCHAIILDLHGLEYLSSTGIRVLIRAHKELEKLQGQILLVGIPKPIENILYITGFLPYFKIFENSALALAVINDKGTS